MVKFCQIKKGIVEIEEMEKGVRRYLKFGPTIFFRFEVCIKKVSSADSPRLILTPRYRQ